MKDTCLFESSKEGSFLWWYTFSSSSSSYSSSSSSSSIGTTAHCGLWPVEQRPSIFFYLPPTLSIFSLPALEDLFLLPLSFFSCVLSTLALPVSSIISFILPGFSMACMFHVARVISVYPVFFHPSSFHLSSFSLCLTFVTVSFITGWGC